MSADNKILHKYMSFETGFVVLNNNTLRWSSPRTLNDPFEMRTELRIPDDSSEIRDATLYKMWNIYRDGIPPEMAKSEISRAILLLRHHTRCSLSQKKFWAEFIDIVDSSLSRLRTLLPSFSAEIIKGMENSKVLCLTEDELNPAMWAHYGEENKGLVLSFADFPGGDSPIKVARPVNYVDEAPSWLNTDNISDILSGIAYFDPLDAMNTIVYSKGEDWSYEKEWRIFTGDGRFPDKPFEDIKFDPRELCSIIYGMNMSEENRDTIWNLSRDFPNVKLYTIEMSSRYRYAAVPYTK